MLPRNACPADDQLARLKSGLLTDEDLQELDPHLESCELCAKRIESLPSVDAIEELLACTPSAALDVSTIATFDRLVRRLHELPTGPPPDAPGTATALGETSSGVDETMLEDLDLTFLGQSAHPDELGRLGGYRLLRVLGSGGMGIVFHAEDAQLRRPVALKVIRPRAAALPGAAERFLREAQAAAAVRHENVVTIYQVGRDRDIGFIAQELLSGETLDERLIRDRTLNTGEAVEIARQIAVGLAAAHARGLMHRDIKPANIWLEPQEPSGSRVKILDFGLARPWDDDTATITQSGVIIGTPAYMAPEQAAGAALDARADLFSLGAVLYRMLTGVSPFGRASVLATLHALANEAPVPPRDLEPAIPLGVSDFALELLAKQMTDRPPSAKAVAERLAALPIRKSSPLAGGRQLVAWAIGALAVLVLAILFVVRNLRSESAGSSAPSDATMPLHSAEDKLVAATIWREKGEQKLLAGDLAAAKEHYLLARSVDARSVVDCEKLAAVAAIQGDWPEAIAEFDRAQELEPGNAYWPYYQAYAFLGMEDLQRYREKCQTLKSRSQQPIFADRWLYATLASGGVNADKDELVTVAKELAQYSPQSRRLLGAALFRAGKPALALEEFHKAPPELEVRAWDHFYLAMIHFRLGDNAKACRDYVAGVEWAKSLDRFPGQTMWYEKLETDHLRREAKELLGVSIFLEGDEATLLNSALEAGGS